MVDPPIMYDELRPDSKQPPVVLEQWQWDIWKPCLSRIRALRQVKEPHDGRSGE
jgi:hypothetical protein